MGIENVTLGPCNLTFGGAALGLTKGGVELKITMVPQDYQTLGSPANYEPRMQSVAVEVSVPLAELALTIVAQALPWCGVANGVITVRDAPGIRLRPYAKALVITPIATGDSYTITNAVPIINASYRFLANSERITMVTFKALPDASGNLFTMSL